MPMPLWWGQINKRVFNPRELKKGDRPVLTHVGRSSGKVYQTPVDAHRVDGGYLFILVYGSKSDWVQNILAAGSATLRIDGRETQLTKPRLLNKDEAWTLVDPGTREPPSFLRISEFLQMDEAS